MKEKQSIETFLQFLYNQKLLPFHDVLLYEGKDQSAEEHQSSTLHPPHTILVDKYGTLLDCMQHYFHYFQESTLKAIITEAVNYRNQQMSTDLSGKGSEGEMFGDWGSIIDTMKQVLQQRRELASQHFQQLVSYGMEGNPDTVLFYLKQLHSNGFIDHLFSSILKETLTAVKKQGTQNEDNLYMLTFFQKTIIELQLEVREKEDLERQRYALRMTSISAPEPTPLSKVDSGPVQSNEANKEEQLMQYSQLLNQFIKESQGNIPNLQKKLIQLFERTDFHLETFQFILQEHIKACQQANYQNKLKLLQFLQDFTHQHFHSTPNESDQIQQVLNQKETESNLSKLSTYHAPQFIDREGNNNGQALTNIQTYSTIFSASHLIFNEQTSSPSIPIPTNNKKKKLFRKQMKQKIQAFLQDCNRFLYEHGWVVIDHFVALELIKRVRIESNLFRHFFEQSEIWVGKKADVGAHLSVPSIRGDRVLWVCGGHNVLNQTEEEEDEEEEPAEGEEAKKIIKKPKSANHSAPEGMSRAIKTIGEIEPCKLEVKASAPLRKFSALKELITSCDKLVEEFKHFQDPEHPHGLHSIYERSDAMLSIYPGEGARFANHVDNTTKDGRVLTFLTYLNPVWTEDMGGAIRLRPKRHGYTPPPPSSSQPRESSSSFPNFQDCDGIDVYPIAGRAVLFFSSQIEHEVLPTYGDRHAITIWYYDKQERKEAIERAKQDGMAQKVAAASIETQQTAKEFIGELMGGDEIGADGGNPTTEELQTLAKKVELLSDEVLEIIASITGAPSVQSFREGFPMLTVQDLKSMRALFRRMGLENGLK